MASAQGLAPANFLSRPGSWRTVNSRAQEGHGIVVIEAAL
jgi:hypothetical protein